MKYSFKFLLAAFALICFGIGVGVTSVWYQALQHVHELRAIESGDAQYHPTTGKFMFNGELEENE